MALSSTVSGCLDDLASRIDEAEEAAQREAWLAFVRDEIGTGTFTPPARVPKPPRVDWPKVHVNDALHDREAMLLHQFGAVSQTLANGGTSALGVRCNYGTSIMTSQLGCTVVEMPREQGNLPTSIALDGGVDALDAMLERGVPDLRNGQGGDVFDTGELFLEVMRRWPVIGRWVELYHPDAQGPIDNAELVWGTDIFLAFFDAPDRVHAVLELMTEHYLAFLGKWFEMVPTEDEMTVHWGLRMPGRVMLRDDSLMNLSSEVYTEFIRDREQRCLQSFGGGAIHFCGRGDHFIEAMTEMDGLLAINMSQPHLNNMDRIYAATVDRGIPLVGFNGSAARDAGRDLRGRVHC